MFALPSTELAVPPAGENGAHEIFFLCAVSEERWSSITRVTLPSSSTIGVYQPKHASPPSRQP